MEMEKVRFAWSVYFHSASTFQETLMDIFSVLTRPMTVTHRNLKMTHSWTKELCPTLNVSVGQFLEELFCESADKPPSG